MKKVDRVMVNHTNEEAVTLLIKNLILLLRENH